MIFSNISNFYVWNLKENEIRQKKVFADIFFDLVYHSEKKRENSNRGQKMSAKVSQRFLYSLPTLAPPPDCQTFRRLCDTSKCTSNSCFLSNNYFDFLLTHQGQKQPIEKYDFGSLKFDLFLLIRQVSRVIMSVYLFLVKFFLSCTKSH